MDTKTYEAIRDDAERIIEFSEIPDQLRKIAEFIVEPSHKRKLKAIAKFLEKDAPDVFRSPAKVTALEIVRVLGGEAFLSDEEAGGKIGKSASTVKQTVGALKAGGVQFEESHARGFRMRDRKGYGKKRAIAP